MATVVRLGPLPLGHRSGSRIAELERILGTPVLVVETATLDEFVIALAGPNVIAVALTCSTATGCSRRRASLN